MRPEPRDLLLVEDDPDDAQALLESLRAPGGVEPVHAADGGEALDFLYATGKHARRDRTQPPVLVVLDWELPRVSGAEVLRSMRADRLLRYVPVVVLTVHGQAAKRVEALDGGASVFISKPTGRAELARIGRWIRDLALF